MSLLKVELRSNLQTHEREFDDAFKTLTPFLIAKGFTPHPQERGLKVLIFGCFSFSCG